MTEIVSYGNGQYVRSFTMIERNPMNRKGNRVYWNEKPGDVYAATGISPFGERVRVTGSWGEIKRVTLSKGTRWLIRNGKKWKINSF